jgi:hypothetical protein
MRRLLAWLVRGECLRHSDPLFDRDPQGRAVFRCQRCLATWAILPDLAPRRMAGATSEPIGGWRRVLRAERLVVRPHVHAPARGFAKRAA